MTFDPVSGAESARYRHVTDVRGSVRLVVNADTVGIAQRLDYDAHGEVTFEYLAPGFDQPFGYAGGLRDRATGLTRFGARDYDPRIGRWTAKDPIGFAAGDGNLYGYVGGDPVNGVDPSGLYDWNGRSDGVYICRESLNGSGSLLGYHWWLAVKHRGDSGAPDEFGFGQARPDGSKVSSGTMESEGYRSHGGGVEHCERVRDVDTDCVIEFVQSHDNGGFNLATHNCQHAALRAVRNCGASGVFLAFLDDGWL